MLTTLIFCFSFGSLIPCMYTLYQPAIFWVFAISFHDEKMFRKMSIPIWFFLHDKHVQTVFGTCFAFLLGIFNSNLCVPASPSPWQINPFLNMDSSPYSLAAPPSPVGCLPTAPTVGGWQRARWWSITQWRALRDESGWQPQSRQSAQQPITDGSSKGWWRLATRARRQRLAIGN